MGFVRDEDNSPVGGAAVTIGQSGAVVTNDDGSFDLVWHTSNPQYGVFITVAKVAYESTMAYSDSLKEVGKRTFRLFRPRFITVGDSITLELSADNSLCGLEGEWTCRGVRVTSGSVGVLKAAVGTDDDWASFELANAIQYPYKASTTLAIPVRAGSVTTLWVLGAWNMKRPGLFTLTTTLER